MPNGDVENIIAAKERREHKVKNMGLSNEAIETSYAFCRRLSHQSGSNFYLGFLFLPHEKRRAMDALYAFMRHTDDLADEVDAQHQNSSDSIIEQKKLHLQCWRSALDKALAGDAIAAGQSISDDQTGKNLLPALVDSVHKFGIPTDCLYAVIDGVEMDLVERRFETFNELEIYCQRVASAVGLACIHIWGFRGQGTPEGRTALELARQAGIAMQLTNILRDIKDDTAAGRIYLPLEDVRKCGHSEEELKNGLINESFHRLINKESERAKQAYREGVKLMDYLHHDGHRIYGLMISVYWKLLEIISKRPEDIFVKHISLGKFERILMAAGWKYFPKYHIKRLINKR